MRRHCKLIISTITMALIFTLCFSPASYAISQQQFSAWVGSALMALNIGLTSTIMPIADAARDFNDFLAAPARFVLNQFIDVPYSTPIEGIDDYLNQSVLKIDKDVVTIDGVDYTDVWLSTDAAEKFRVNALDIENAWDIASHSEGTYASGVGKYRDVLMYQMESTGDIVSQPYLINNPATPDDGSYAYGEYLIGGYDISVRTYKQSVYNRYQASLDNSGSWTMISSQTPATSTLQIKADNQNRYRWNNNGTFFGGNLQDDWDGTPFDFDWVAGEIPADEELTTEGLRIRVPTDDINQWYQDYPDTGPNITINMGDPELENQVEDLIDLIIPLIPVLDIDFVDYESPTPVPEPEPIPEPEPYPDPDPQPGTVIPDLDWTDLFQTIKNIFNKISEQVSITTAIKNLLDKIKWFLDDFFGDLGDLIGNLPDLFERHVIDTIRRGLTGLKNIFYPILILLRNALGIWHYVVEWFQAISTPFTFYLSVLGQGYPLITIPIYASIAGVIVIAVYRRFGR